MIKPKKKFMGEKGALEIIEEAVSLVRGSGSSALAYYYLGSLPFVLGLLYYWADMSKSAFAYARVEGGAFVLALLFVWMKTWQAVYGQELLSAVVGATHESPLRWTATRLARIAVKQGIAQPSGLFVLPVALMLTLPFGRTYALFQNMTVLDDGNDLDVRGLMKRSSELAKVWGKQNFFLIWALSPFLVIAAAAFFLAVSPIIKAFTPEWTTVLLYIYSFLFALILMPLSPFGMAVALNIAALIMIIPQALKMFLGVETVYTITPGNMMNGMFFAVVCGLTYLCLDPLVKAAYVLRCFYGESLRTGTDLRVELKRYSGKAASALVLFVLLAGLIAPVHAKAEERDAVEIESAQSSVSPTALDKALDSELKGREYAWRMPREKRPETEDGIITSILRYIYETMGGWFETMGKWIDKFINWFRRHWPETELREQHGGNLWEISGPLMAILLTLLAALLSVVGVLVYRILKRRAQAAPVVSQAIAATPDIEDESTSADQLPEEGWLKMARELCDSGQYRLALRAVFLGSLATLGHFNLIQIARFKSNMDYRRELDRRAHATPREALDAFSDSVSIYEAIWYGMHDATRELLDNVMANQEKLKACAQRQ